ncbi:SAM-dependent methyltransferase [Neisseria meningitidis]|uniref:SAM-dependent methyltransferase n=1 Tax=Neisseria meningitidis TaxID=487 RepID=UPI000319570B|nr:SAM-dependent methyltransferase [Neisseria meningitidis]MCL4986687.1 SAM-dependent methyltransferase [Neisseria meningitidis]MCL5690660.1 SAM-dependent methyltransferase [Neisseria meningitidis]MCL6071414.1 SAM-dependent methyltransferase [Neisseria meningitidis]
MSEGMVSPVLYLIPTPLGTPDTPCLLPHEQRAVVGLTDFVVEAEKTARAHLKHLGVTMPIRELNLQTLNEHTDLKTLPELLKPLQEGRSMGIVSEAGCPAVADPGANLVALAHKHGFEVRPLVGPSSLLLALMASGANGQNFAFKGYLPSEKNERIQSLKALEQRSRQQNETQLFIETPYRNDVLLADAVENLHSETRLCTATDLTLPTQSVVSKTVADWRRMKEMPNLKKRPTIFVMYAG